MKYYIILLTIGLAILGGCSGDKKNAQQMYDKAKTLMEKNEFSSAKTVLDSIKSKYPSQIEILKSSLRLRRICEQKETIRNIAFCDSFLPIREHERDSLAKAFKYEKDPKYDVIGKYLFKNQTIEKNIQRCYIRSGVSEKGEMFIASVFYGGRALQHTGLKLSLTNGTYAETPAIAYDGGKNFRFVDLGRTTEVVTYSGKDCEDIVKLIYNNPKARIKAEYTGGKPYFIYMSEGDKAAVIKTFELAVVLNDITKMNEEIEKGARKLEYIKMKLRTTNIQ